jgi:hypothetical protein
MVTLRHSQMSLVISNLKEKMKAMATPNYLGFVRLRG